MTDRSEIEQAYLNTVGFIPTNLDRKFEVFGETAPDLLIEIERARARALDTGLLDPADVQLLQFVVYAGLQLEEATHTHARAALRLGKSVEHLIAVAGVIFVARGMPAFNLAVRAISAAKQSLAESKAEA
jgi:alkylhydroperoxidase/carboxymuconolactone decarboxylase family protein YurZ